MFGPVPRWDQPASTLIARAMLHGTLADLPEHLYDGVAPLDGQADLVIRGDIGDVLDPL